MDKRIRTPAAAQELVPVSLGELIHEHVRAAIETAVREELSAVSRLIATLRDGLEAWRTR